MSVAGLGGPPGPAVVELVGDPAAGPPVALGVDAGSTTCKAAAVDASGRLLAWTLAPMTPRVAAQAEAMLAALQEACGVPPDVGAALPVDATGYGRRLVTRARSAVTEITCHARGVFAATGGPGTLVDIGGQDSKVIRIGAKGAPVDFAMNDKCAAGTGRFLEHTAARLGLPVDDIGDLARGAAREGRVATVTSTCTVFAESEIISLLADGAQVDEVLAGLHRGLVSRILTMVRGVGLAPPLLLSGGVARNPAVVALLGELSGQDVRVPELPQLMGAYGAALLAARGR